LEKIENYVKKLIKENTPSDLRSATPLKKGNDNPLESIKILDPAGGSGAFPNQVHNFLTTKWVEKLNQTAIESNLEALADFDQNSIDKSILKNNIFMVDLQPESTEIAKLSLWLKTAKKDQKLNNLDENIKCGNSLIDDPEIAGDKAFDWEKEFPEVFDQKKDPLHTSSTENVNTGSELGLTSSYQEVDEKACQTPRKELNGINEKNCKDYYKHNLSITKHGNLLQKNNPVYFTQKNENGKGGFDVIVGNPPYGAKLSKKDQEYLLKAYQSGSTETVILFIQKSLNLLKKGGYLGFIIPKSFEADKVKILQFETKINKVDDEIEGLVRGLYRV